MSVEDFIIYVYCCADDIYRTIVKQPLKRRGFMPKLSDAEVITMEIVGEFMSKDHDKGIWRNKRNHWHDGRCFKGEAGFGYCVANVDERDVLPEMAASLHGLLIGDKGYIRPSLKQELVQQGIDLQTPLRKNMQDIRSKAFVGQLMSTRRLLETVIGQLTERFHIEKVKARDTWHLANRFIRKLLAHTMGCFLGKLMGNPT